MALATYSDLESAIAAWLNRADLTARIPDFVKLAENEFNRLLRTEEMETRATATLTGDAVAVPADMVGLISISMDNTVLEQVTAQEALDDEREGVPCRYARTDGQFFFRPAPSTGDVTITYYAAIPALTSGAPTNWLMTKHPDLYLFAALAQAEFFGWNDPRLPIVKARVEEIMGQIESAAAREKFGGHRLVPVANRP